MIDGCGGERLPPVKVLRALVAVAVVAIVIRLVYVVFVAGTSLLTPWGTSDAPDYHAIAANLSSGLGFTRDVDLPATEVGDARLPRFSDERFAGPKAPTAYRPPLYPAFMAMIYAVAGQDSFLAIRVGQAVLGGLAVFLTGWMAFLLSESRAAAMLAAFLLAVNPLSVYFTGELLTETLFSGLVLLALCFLAVPATSLAGVVAFGLVLGLAALVRSTALALVPVGVAALVAHRRIGGTSKLKPPAVVSAAAFLCGVAIVVTPWVARNTMLFDEWTGLSTNGGVNLTLGISREWTETIGATDLALVDSMPEVPHATEVQWDKALSAFARARIVERPWRFARLFVRKWVHFFSPFLSDRHRPLFRVVAAVSFLPLVSGVLLWPLVCWRRRTPRARMTYLLLCGAVLVFSMAHSLYISNVRFRVPIGEPVFAIFAADVAWTWAVSVSGSLRERWGTGWGRRARLPRP